MVSNVLGLDPATKCGWAIKRSNKIKSGVWDLSNGAFDGAGMSFVKLRKCLFDFVIDVDLVAYEAVMSHGAGGAIAQHKYGGFIAVIQSVCEELNTPYVGVNVKSVKKFWTGSGSAGKDKMIHEARVRGYNPIDDNEADAIAIMYYAIEKYVLAIEKYITL